MCGHVEEGIESAARHRTLDAGHLVKTADDQVAARFRFLADFLHASLLSLKRGGRLVTCGSTSGVSTPINLMQLFQQQLKILGSFGCRMENMTNAMQKMAAGLVHPVIDTEVDFDGIGEALKRMESRDVFGKIILRVG